MLDTLASVGDFAAVAQLPSRIGTADAVLYYHSIDVVYRRVIANPVQLDELADFDLLGHFEQARAGIYALYQCLHGFLALIAALSELLDMADQAGAAGGVTLSADFAPSLSPEAKHAIGAAQGEKAVADVLEKSASLLTHFAASRDRCDELCVLLRAACSFSRRYSDDIFGQTNRRFLTSRVLCAQDMTGGPGQESPRQRLELLQAKAQTSVVLVQESEGAMRQTT